MKLLKGFLHYLFSYSARWEDMGIPIDEIVPDDSPQKEPERGKPKKRIPIPERNRLGIIIVTINIVLAIVCILSLVAVIVYPLIPSAKLPDTVNNVLVGTVGYFGGALASYVDHYNKF